MSLRATVRDVAKHAAVSTATVSRVINDTGLVSDETRSRVLAAIDALGYSPNIIAAQLSRQGNGVPKRRRAPKSRIDLTATKSTTKDSPGRGTVKGIKALEKEIERLRKLVAHLGQQLDRKWGVDTAHE